VLLHALHHSSDSLFLLQALKYPRYAFKDLIDLLGKKASNPIISEYKKRYPFYDIEADPDTGLVAFKLEE